MSCPMHGERGDDYVNNIFDHIYNDYVGDWWKGKNLRRHKYYSVYRIWLKVVYLYSLLILDMISEFFLIYVCPVKLYYVFLSYTLLTNTYSGNKYLRPNFKSNIPSTSSLL